MTNSINNTATYTTEEQYVNPFEPTVFDDEAQAQQELDEQREYNELFGMGLIEGYQF